MGVVVAEVVGGSEGRSWRCLPVLVVGRLQVWEFMIETPTRRIRPAGEDVRSGSLRRKQGTAATISAIKCLTNSRSGTEGMTNKSRKAVEGEACRTRGRETFT